MTALIDGITVSGTPEEISRLLDIRNDRPTNITVTPGPQPDPFSVNPLTPPYEPKDTPNNPFEPKCGGSTSITMAKQYNKDKTEILMESGDIAVKSLQ